MDPLVVLLAQRDRVFLRDASDGRPALRVPVLATGYFAGDADAIEVQLNLHGGGITQLRGRLLASWVLGSENCPVTFAEEPGDLVLGEVVRGGRVAVRLFAGTGGVLLLLRVSEALH